MATFPGHTAQTILTAEVKIGDRMYFPGASLLLPVNHVRRDTVDGADWITFRGTYESWGRPRRAYIRRAAGGRSTIHVPDPG